MFKVENILDSFPNLFLSKINTSFFYNTRRFTQFLYYYITWIIDHLFNQYPIFLIPYFLTFTMKMPLRSPTAGSISDSRSWLLHSEIHCYIFTKIMLPMDCSQTVILCGKKTKAGSFLEDTGIF